MRLPRRVPWSSITELDQVCSWIYSDGNDTEAKVQAIQRLSAWKAITTLPHALESTLAILTVIVQDTAQEGSSSYLLTRQAYASALIRLVNGLVDPLQLGAYARSIASIAAQLGLPAWIVELRHAATHEDLPSLELLREASREAMVWLLNNYFIPALNPSAPPKTRAPPLRPLSPLLSQYKGILKITTRDASLRSQYKAETSQVLRDIERWVAEAKVAADISAATLEWDSSGVDGPELEDTRARWALDRLCDVLLEKGGLVPLSKKKRVVETNPFQPSASILTIWTPLLAHLHALHPSLQHVLLYRIISTLLSNPMAPDSTTELETISLDANDRLRDPSYDMCLASWAFWLISSGSGSADPDDEMAKVEEAAVALVTGLGPSVRVDTDLRAARYLLDALCKKHPALQATASLLLSASGSTSASRWSDDDLQTMSQRLDALVSSYRNAATASSTSTMPEVEVSAHSTTTADLPQGWRIMTARDGWKPAPIGVHVG